MSGRADISSRISSVPGAIDRASVTPSDTHATSAEQGKQRASITPKFCVICGARSSVISTTTGLWTCDRHYRSPANQARFGWLTGRMLVDEYLTVPHWMWIWKAGHKEPCQVCGQRTTRFLSGSGETDRTVLRRPRTRSSIRGPDRLRRLRRRKRLDRCRRSMAM